MKPALIAAALLLAAAPALAQTPSPTPPGPGPTPPPPPPPPGASASGLSGVAGQPGSAGPGRPIPARIDLRGPNGAELRIRCAPGESSKACADVAGELLGRISGMMAAGRDYERSRYGRGDGGAGRGQDDDHDEREARPYRDRY